MNNLPLQLLFFALLVFLSAHWPVTSAKAIVRTVRLTSLDRHRLPAPSSASASDVNASLCFSRQAYPYVLALGGVSRATSEQVCRAIGLQAATLGSTTDLAKLSELLFQCQARAKANGQGNKSSFIGSSTNSGTSTNTTNASGYGEHEEGAPLKGAWIASLSQSFASQLGAFVDGVQGEKDQERDCLAVDARGNLLRASPELCSRLKHFVTACQLPAKSRVEAKRPDPMQLDEKQVPQPASNHPNVAKVAVAKQQLRQSAAPKGGKVHQTCGQDPLSELFGDSAGLSGSCSLPVPDQESPEYEAFDERFPLEDVDSKLLLRLDAMDRQLDRQATSDANYDNGGRSYHGRSQGEAHSSVDNVTSSSQAGADSESSSQEVLGGSDSMGSGQEPTRTVDAPQGSIDGGPYRVVFSAGVQMGWQPEQSVNPEDPLSSPDNSGSVDRGQGHASYYGNDDYNYYGTPYSTYDTTTTEEDSSYPTDSSSGSTTDSSPEGSGESSLVMALDADCTSDLCSVKPPESSSSTGDSGADEFAGSSSPLSSSSPSSSASSSSSADMCPLVEQLSLAPFHFLGYKLIQNALPFGQAECACGRFGMRPALVNFVTQWPAALVVFQGSSARSMAWVDRQLGLNAKPDDQTGCLALKVPSLTLLGHHVTAANCQKRLPVLCQGPLLANWQDVVDATRSLDAMLAALMPGQFDPRQGLSTVLGQLRDTLEQVSPIPALPDLQSLLETVIMRHKSNVLPSSDQPDSVPSSSRPDTKNVREEIGGIERRGDQDVLIDSIGRRYQIVSRHQGSPSPRQAEASAPDLCTARGLRSANFGPELVAPVAQHLQRLNAHHRQPITHASFVSGTFMQCHHVFADGTTYHDVNPVAPRLFCQHAEHVVCLVPSSSKP